jgi:3D (Asp-Asp-Asp) domain-containing protein
MLAIQRDYNILGELSGVYLNITKIAPKIIVGGFIGGLLLGYIEYLSLKCIHKRDETLVILKVKDTGECLPPNDKITGNIATIANNNQNIDSHKISNSGFLNNLLTEEFDELDVEEKVPQKLSGFYTLELWGRYKKSQRSNTQKGSKYKGESSVATTINNVESSVSRTLARITVYWAHGGNSDSNTKKNLSSTGEKLKEGAIAVDPKVIPYGSVVKIKGKNNELKAVDTGGAVKARTAAKIAGRNKEEKSAPVIDVFFQNKSDALRYAANNPPFQWIEIKKPN